MRILGIDPGLQKTGWGIVEAVDNRLSFIMCGLIKTDAALTLGERLSQIDHGMSEVLDVWKPDEAAIEETFMNNNPASALKLGCARGVAMVVPAKAGIIVHEYAPNLIKKSVVGNGHATKDQVEMMVRTLIPSVGRALGADEADALAIAICHAHHATTRNRFSAIMAGGGTMIGKLSGIIDDFGTDYILLDVGGVGYLVHCSPRTLQQSGQKGDAASLLIDTHVREDAINLYGFKDAMEQQWFRLLTSVQGVGARVGMSILGTCPPERLGFAIASGDKAAVQQADGVGPKLALRIVTELKDKAGKVDFNIAPAKSDTPKAANAQNAPVSLDHDAVSALVNLGYAKSDAFQAVLMAKQKANDNAALSEIIRLALKELSA